MIRSRRTIPVFVTFLSPIMLACNASQPMSPTSNVVLDRAPTHAVSKPRLAVCPSHTTETVSREIGPEGGTLSLAGHSISIPAGALDRSTQITLTAPAGRHLQILVIARATEPSRMPTPAAVTISYERCKRQNLDPISAAVISPQLKSKGVMTALESETDPIIRTLTFEVELSSDGEELFVARGIYAVAY